MIAISKNQLKKLIKKMKSSNKYEQDNIYLKAKFDREGISDFEAFEHIFSLRRNKTIKDEMIENMIQHRRNDKFRIEI